MPKAAIKTMHDGCTPMHSQDTANLRVCRAAPHDAQPANIPVLVEWRLAAQLGLHKARKRV